MTLTSRWEAPSTLSRREIVATSDAVMARPEITFTEQAEHLRIRALELDWDVGGQLFEPSDPSRIPSGADGKKVGLFLLHGGAGDHRSQAQMARFIVSKFGYKVVTMTYPGKLYFPDPNHDWPGDTINPDGTARTPMWKVDEPITPDQYELIQDTSDPAKRAKWGTLFFLRAKEGTLFYHRMAAWPYAFEETMKAFCARHFPEGEFSIYAHGHSTGGPFIHLLLQRVPNIAGLAGMETSPWGSLYSRMLGMRWGFPFTYLTLRTWRHIAKYAGAEAGPEGAWRLPWLMEDVLEQWDRSKRDPQFKAEYLVTYGQDDQLEAAARAVADRLKLDTGKMAALVERYRGFGRELSGAGVKPVPPLLYGIAQGSRDHRLKRYQEVLLPAVASMDPPPKARVVLFEGGVHGYTRPEEGLPRGLLPAVARLWDEAIKGGYYIA